MKIQTTFRNVDYPQARCPHLHPVNTLEECAALWQQFRGTPVVIETDSFRKGHCDGCDTWLIVDDPRGSSVARCEIEIGD